MGGRNFLLFIGSARLFVWAVASVLGLSMTYLALAAPGDFDRSFGASGVASVSKVSSDLTGADVLVASDGGLIVSGASGGELKLNKWKSDGSPDPDFGSEGIVILAYEGGPIGSSLPMPVCEDPNQRIIVGFSSPTGGSKLARLLSNGTIDPSFGNAGIVETTVHGQAFTIFRIGFQPDGRIVLAGGHYTESKGNDFAVCRLLETGEIDTTFGSSGLVKLSVSSGYSAALDFKRLSDGRLVVIGTAEGSAAFQLFPVIVRLLSDGSLDDTFGISGIKVLDAGALSSDAVSQLAIQSDGKLIVVGQTTSGGSSSAFIFRCTSDGTIDLSFGEQGRVQTQFGIFNSGWIGVQTDADDKIVVIGRAGPLLGVISPLMNFYDDVTSPVMRFFPNGSVDLGFGSGGVVRTRFESGGRPTAIATQVDGKLVALGGTNVADITLTRLEGGTSAALGAFGVAMQAARFQYFDAGATATPQHDGVANLLKYAFNMELGTADRRVMEPGTGTSGLPVITCAPNAGMAGVFRFEFLRRIGSGLVYTPKKSADLSRGSWMDLASTPVVTPIDAEWERVVHDEPFDPVLTPQLFGTVEVVIP